MPKRNRDRRSFWTTLLSGVNLFVNLIRFFFDNFFG